MATLLGSSSMVVQYGVSGAYWYAVGGGIQLALFAFLSISMKIKAPGAKTALQFIRAEYGKDVHILFMCYFLAINFVVFAGLLVEATNAINLVVDDLMPEFSSMLLALLIGGYTIVGGLGGTFFVAYTNAVLLFVLILLFQSAVYMDPMENYSGMFSNFTKFYQLVDCSDQITLVTNSSVITFGSPGEWKFGFSNFFYFFGFTVLDQGVWQGTVASKPPAGAVGFIVGAFAWMAVSIGLATTVGLSFIGLNTIQDAPILTNLQINQGLVLPVVAFEVLGTAGTYLMLALILLAVMSTGSGQVIAIASITVYDIYQPYIQPYVENLPKGICQLCMKAFTEHTSEVFKGEICDCGSMRRCIDCIHDDKARHKALEAGDLVPPHYTCENHKDFRVYQENMLKFANWCVVVTTIMTVPIIWPLTSIANSFDLNLANIFIAFGIPLNSGWIPMTLAILWPSTKSLGLILGCISGLVTGLLGWIIAVSMEDEGITLSSAVHEDPLLIGNVLSLVVSLVVTVFVSKFAKDEEGPKTWEKSVKILNPLTPWVAQFEAELEAKEGIRYIDVPYYQSIKVAFKTSWLASLYIPVGMTFLLMGVLPAIFQAQHMSESQFSAWINICIVWTLGASLLVFFLPFLQQIYDIYVEKFKNTYSSQSGVSTPDSIYTTVG